jgi:hypothetical protein
MDETFADGAETDFENGEQDFKDFTSDHLMVIDTWEDKLNEFLKMVVMCYL